MFKRENRLVPGVRFKNSCFYTTPQFVLKKKKNDLTVNRFGIIVSKKIDKRAVVRNGIKRFFRAELVNLDRKMNIGHDILFVIKKEACSRTKEENLLAIKTSLDKAGLLGK